MNWKSLDDKIWDQLCSQNPDFLTGEDYPTRGDFFGAGVKCFAKNLQIYADELEQILLQLQDVLMKIDNYKTKNDA